MLLPNADFWRMWAVAAFLALVSILFFSNIQPSHAETCRASFYGSESGRRTASGEAFRPMGRTAAHRSLPFGTRLLVGLGHRSITVTVNDRGPAAATGRCLDLARGAARALGLEARGVALVTIRRLN